MKYSILSVLVGSLLLAGCGGGSDKKNTQSDTPTPVQPQPDANTAVLTLGSNNNIVSLSNVAQATFSTEDAKNNPVITIQKAQDKDLVEPFNWAKQVLDIENGSDYELTLTSSKPLGSTVDMELSVPAELIHALNDQNALAAYIVTTVDEDDSEQGFVPVISTYNPETQKLLVTLPDWALQADDSDKPVNVTMKIGLAKAITDEPATPLTAMARMLTLPTEGESVKETQDTFKLICPVQNAVSGQKNICAETSRFGERNKGTIGKANFHYGLDFEAKIDKTHGYPLIAASAGTVIGINIADNSIAMRVDVNGKESTFVYRHLSEIDNNIKVIDEKNHISGKVTAGTLLGKAGNKNDTPVPVHLHLELINYSLPVCIGDKLKDKTCQTGDHTDTKQGNEKKIKMYNDPFPHFVDSIKLVKTSPKDSAITTGQKFNLELQGFDINGNRITTEIDNKLKVSSASVDTDGTPMLDPEKKLGGIKIQPQGTLRSVNWSVNPASAYKVESDAKLGYQEKLVPSEPKSLVSLKGDDLKKRSSATVTVNQEEPATITAYWDGLENLKATYVFNASGNGYTKISATGQKLPENATEWDCVLDNQTDLMWEHKTFERFNKNDRKLRDGHNLYTWYEDSTGFEDPKDANVMNPYGYYYGYGQTCNFTLKKCNTRAYIKALNEIKLCGFSDWRLPTKNDFWHDSSADPFFASYINTTDVGFDLVSTHVWTSNSSEEAPESYAVSINLYDSSIFGLSKELYLPIRAVRNAD